MRLSLFIAEKVDLIMTPIPLTKENIMTENQTVIVEATTLEAKPKLFARVKNTVTHPNFVKGAITGAAVTFIGAVVFAFKRQDESDFDAQAEEWNAEESNDNPDA